MIISGLGLELIQRAIDFVGIGVIFGDIVDNFFGDLREFSEEVIIEAFELDTIVLDKGFQSLVISVIKIGQDGYICGFSGGLNNILEVFGEVLITLFIDNEF